MDIRKGENIEFFRSVDIGHVISIVLIKNWKYNVYKLQTFLLKYGSAKDKKTILPVFAKVSEDDYMVST